MDKRHLFSALLLACLIVAAGYGLSRQAQPAPTQPKAITPVATSTVVVEAPPPEPTTYHVPLPDEVRGLYWTADTAGSSTKRAELTQYIVVRKLNTVVIDLKMDNGALAFAPKDVSLKRYAMERPPMHDLEQLLKSLGEKNIYRIARLPVMRDSIFAAVHPAEAVQTKGGKLWRDKTGAAWADPGSPKVAEYALLLAREAIELGFDEVQFDYVRFPSDGALSTIVYPLSEGKDKAVVMRAFFDKMGTLREEGIVISFDVFGMTYWSTNHFGIGQRLEDVYPNADFISPMVYPSHYPTGFRGFENPALYPYEIVKQSLDKGAEMLEVDRFISPTSSRPKTRPWIQDFDIGAVYTAARIEAQIKAARDAGASGWMLWNARNVYEPAKYD